MNHVGILNEAKNSCEKINLVLPKYIEQKELLALELERSVVRKEFAIGGKTIHRGYYCPSPIYDIIVGGSNRGRLVKRPGQGEITYVYGMDAANNVVLADSFWGGKEYIFHTGDTVLSIIFRENFPLLPVVQVSECSYQNGKLQSYTLFDADGHNVTAFWREEYSYGKDGLLFADVQRYAIAPQVSVDGLMMHQRYYFEHDENGYLSSFLLEAYSNKDLTVPASMEGPYQIKQKRKV